MNLSPYPVRVFQGRGAHRAAPDTGRCPQHHRSFLQLRVPEFFFPDVCNSSIQGEDCTIPSAQLQPLWFISADAKLLLERVNALFKHKQCHSLLQSKIKMKIPFAPFQVNWNCCSAVCEGLGQQRITQHPPGCHTRLLFVLALSHPLISSGESSS